MKCYVGTPSVDYDKSKVVIYLTDAFGIELVNNLVCICDITLAYPRRTNELVASCR